MEPKGSPIPGSRYYRWYCESCGTPLRVILLDDGQPGIRECEDCNPHPPPPARARPPYDDEDGAWHNVIRALENG